MKKKEKSELRGATLEELIKQISGVEKTAAEKMRDRATKSVKNVREIKMLRKKIAVLKTVVRQKEFTHE
ncbi:50S ribosomal protein L29 [Candidatus Gottesmanbacteria bacterium RIFCSPLOWO2_01_FULL_43_11b]|uniref:Large ribosomal subunit protein uL29 n=1 Tax=Candidatus Gottesmanbacteria bacterium RIFCSPLOWO2_01_FULL_43_11b TaxID=1798392 RepID=A0A1F6AHS0_9BACT|nr:MAG: 50S ribosomal protein L29 [Candidatus Gottesmanbacteria bacterium RIFCSPLOWO2_01_FULL_43_11b]